MGTYRKRIVAWDCGGSESSSLESHKVADITHVFTLSLWVSCLPFACTKMVDRLHCHGSKAQMAIDGVRHTPGVSNFV